VEVLVEIKYQALSYQSIESSNALGGRPVWSLDGRWIYYASLDGGDLDIFRIHPDGTGQANLTKNWPSNELMPAVALP